MKIKQGDAYSIEITLVGDDDAVITPAIVTDVEVMLGKLRKTYADGTLLFDGTYDVSNAPAADPDGVYVFPLTQEETMHMSGTLPLEVRVLFQDETVVGASLAAVTVYPSMSEEVLHEGIG